MPLATSIRLLPALALGLLTASAAAEVSLPLKDVPVPYSRPVEPTAYAPGPAEVMASGSLGALNALAKGKAIRQAGLSTITIALERLDKGDVAGALRIRNGLPKGSADRALVTWATSTAGADISSRDIAAAMEELRDWPGQDTLRRSLERALHRERASAASVIDLLGDRPPLTSEGSLAIARALVGLGRQDDARNVIAPFWRKTRLEAGEESAILREFGSLLGKADHRARMEKMLHIDRVASAMRAAPRAGSEALAKAWTAVIRKERNAAQLLDAVPEAQRGAGYVFAKSRHLRWAGKYREAAAVMLTAPTDADSLVDPDAWWIERRVLSRELLDVGDPQTAYRLAAAHSAETPVHAADAEFHAGWYALRHLDDADKAALHFSRIATVAEGAISLARAHYWLGRAAEHKTKGSGTTHFEAAAVYGTTFYGQLAAARIGRDALAASAPAPRPEDKITFEARPAVQALRRLEAAGEMRRADTLYRALAAEISSPGEVALLAGMAEARTDHTLTLRVGKIAASRGVDVGALSHPIGAIPASASISGAGKALAYAIARQESEFNRSAVSGAGARGLLQLLPGTAKAMAKQAGLGYSHDRLTTDPGYNATLGAAYLADQLERFDGSYVLTFAGYNAGPGRAAEWVKRYGDPRGKDIDTIIDWIERIPYTETRNYVQRVMENYQVYKMRLSGRFDIASDLVSGR